MAVRRERVQSFSRHPPTTVDVHIRNRMRGPGWARAPLARDEFILHSPTERGESECVGQDSNLGTPAGKDLESLAFDQA